MASTSTGGAANAFAFPRRRLDRFSTVDALVGLLRDAILDGLLDPGQPLTEGRIADNYGVSRPTAKAAIRELVRERVLRQQPNKPAVVAEPDADDVIDLFRLRIPLELEILREIVTARAVVEPDFQLPNEAHAAVEDMLGMVDREVKPHEFVSADLRFHKALARAAGSDRLLHVFEELEGEMHLSMLQSYRFLDRSAIGQQHREILDSLEFAVASPTDDWRPAKKLMKEHLRTACRLIATGLRSRETVQP